MIRYDAQRRQVGEHVHKYDRWALLTRLENLRNAHDVLIACGAHGSEEAYRMRREHRRILRRLGVAPAEINKQQSERGPMPRYDEREEGGAQDPCRTDTNERIES